MSEHKAKGAASAITVADLRGSLVSNRTCLDPIPRCPLDEQCFLRVDVSENTAGTGFQ